MAQRKISRTAYMLAKRQLVQEKKKKKMSVADTVKRKKEILKQLIEEAGRR